MKLANIYPILLLCLLAIAQNSFAQGTPTLNIQGVLRNSNGTAVDNGTYQIRFALYTVATGGTEVWSETQAAVPVSGGVYSTALGNTTPMTAAFDQTYYLGVKVGSGAEMTPRAQLSSAPYALSLIGQGNTFPSSGVVGVGTNAPTAGNELHVKDATAAAQVTVEGATTSKVVVQSTTGSSIDLKKGANTASITYDGTNVNIDNLNLSNYSPANLAVTSKLAVGQGSVDATHAFKVTGKTQLNGYTELTGTGFSYVPSVIWIHGNGSSLYQNASSSYEFLLNSSGRIIATEFWAYSDRRSKKDFSLSNPLTDLTTLQQLRVTNYRHIDVISKGSDFKKGFIAQEVKEAFPEAVTLTSDFIPNVYEVSTRTQFSGGQLTVSLEKKHDFEVGDEVKMMMPDNSERKVAVTALPSEKSFSIHWAESAPEKVFVFGKKIKDFQTVDYDRIYTLNVSATQELARKVEMLEKENTALRQQVGDLKADAKASAEKVEARLRLLESKLTN